VNAALDAPPRRRLLPLVACAGGAVLIGLFAWVVHGALGAKTDRVSRQVQVVQLIRPPPPPPPEEQPPPPEVQPKEEVPIDSPDPKDTPDEPSPMEQLGLDTEGGAGGDAFGLAARKGGRDLAGSGGAAFAWYTGRLKDQVGERLGNDPKLRSKKFTVTVKVWIQGDGRIQEVQLASTTGNRDLDQQIRADLGAGGWSGEPPPLEMPQPVSLRIVSRI